MSLNDKLLKAAADDAPLVPSEHFGVMLYAGNDESGHSINGGKFGGAAKFNGSNAKIDIFKLNLGGAKPRTISAWVYVESLSSAITIYQHGDAANGQRFGFAIDTAGKVYVEYYNRDSITSSSHISVNTWYHLAAVYNGGNIETATNTQIYVDGTAVSMSSTGSQTGVANTANTNYGIGYRADSTSQYFNGKIDQLRIFNKALSSSEITTLYTETPSDTTFKVTDIFNDVSGVALYRFDGTSRDEGDNRDQVVELEIYNDNSWARSSDVSASSGKYYWEVEYVSVTVTGTLMVGVVDTSDADGEWHSSSNYFYYAGNGNKYSGGSSSSYGATYTAGDIIGVALDLDNNTIQWYKNNSLQGASAFTGLTGSYYPALGTGYYSDQAIMHFDSDKWTYSAPTNYVEWSNQVGATIARSDGVNVFPRRFNGTDANMSYEFGLNFKPDWIWLKPRNQTENHNLFDSTRGATKQLLPNTTAAESTQGNTVQSFDVGGFTTNGDNNTNKSGINYVAWCLKANGGTTVSNSDGDITSQVQANTKAGFSIVTWTSTSTISDTIGHGLDKQPDAVLYKKYSGSGSWFVYTDVIDESWDEIVLNDNTAASDYSGTYATSTTFKSVTSSSGANWVSYCFHSVDNFSKIGTYQGTGAEGNLIETGFEIAFLIIRRTSDTGGWLLFDNKRNPVNPRNNRIEANNNQAEQTGSTSKFVDFFSNGFEPQVSDSEINASGSTYFYMAFAADPDTVAPVVANSFEVSSYTGNQTNNSVDVGFNAGLTWIKNRTSGGSYHILFDQVRGLNQVLHSNLTNAQQGSSNNFAYNDGILTFDSNTTWANKNSNHYALWAWKADDNEPTIFGGPAKAVYKFEDNGNDVTGDNDATATSITYGTGKFNKGAIFNGTTSNFKTGTSFTGTNGGSFSLSCWVKIDSTTYENILLGRFSYTTSDKQFILRVRDDATVRLNVYNSSGTGESVTTTATLSVDTFYHIVAVVDGTTKSIYIDGELSVTATGSVSPNSSATGFLEIGGSGHLPSSDTGRLDGMLDQVRIYNAAITDVQVAELYAETVSDNDDTSLGGPPEIIISANANSGFSIVQWEGSGSARDLPHNLSAVPEMIIAKKMDGSQDWYVYHKSLNEGTNPENYFVKLNSTDAQSLNTGSPPSIWAGTAPTATQFSTGSTLQESSTYIAYLWHSVSGYSAFGYWAGGTTTITIGFRADFVMYQDFGAGGSWVMVDSVRGEGKAVYAQSDNAETTQTLLDITDTGFTVTSESSVVKRLYMAFKIN